MPPRHPTRPVAVGDLRADVDVEIAPLVEAVWRLGLRTLSSCQDDAWGRPRGGFVRLVFATFDDGAAFLDAAGRGEVLAVGAPLLAAARRALSGGGDDRPAVREAHVLVTEPDASRPWHLRVTAGGGDGTRLDVLFPRDALAEVERRVRDEVERRVREEVETGG